MPLCPVCTIAVASGVGLCRYLGIDDLISGVWIGAFLFSLFLGTINFLNKKKIKFFLRKPLIFLFWYGIVIIPFLKIGIIGHPLNKFLGVDKLIFGIFSGTIVFSLALLLENYLRKINQGRTFFKFQKVVIPVLFLIILSLTFSQFC